MDKEQLTKLHGRIHVFTVPSGYKVAVREQNGEDDDIVSNAALTETGQSFNIYLSGIIVWTTKGNGGPATPEFIMAMKMRDKYVALIQSRIFSLGWKLKLQYSWPKKDKENEKAIDYFEDLRRYVWDYGNKKKPFPEEDDDKYYAYRIKPYKNPEEIERQISLSSEKLIKYDYADGNYEKYLLELPVENDSYNKIYRGRNLQIKNGEVWEVVKNFKKFSANDMKDLRKDLQTYDPDLAILSELKDPDSGQVVYVEIMANQDFFFPVED